MEENRPWWGVRTSNPGGAVRLSQVGSTPTLFRQYVVRTAPLRASWSDLFAGNGLAGAARPDEQQWIGCVASPACLADEKIEPERRKVVCEWVHLRVSSLEQHLRVGVALVARLRLDRPRPAVDLLQRDRACLTVGDAHGPHMVPGRRAERAI